MNHYWDRVDKAVAAMGWPSFHGMLEGVWQEALAIKLEETKAKIDRLEEIAAASARIEGHWKLCEIYDYDDGVCNCGYNNLLEKLKTALPKEP